MLKVSRLQRNEKHSQECGWLEQVNNPAWPVVVNQRMLSSNQTTGMAQWGP